MPFHRVALALLAVTVAAPASAELVFFTTGRSLSVERHRLEGDSIVLSLRRGGEVVCDPSVIDRIEPDEIPYPQAQNGVPRLASEVLPAVASGTAYDAIIQAVSTAQGVDPHLVHAVIRVESAYRPAARSPKGAMGLMQLMPATARLYNVRNPYDPASNIEAGTRHLRSLLDRLPLNLALAAYNAGEGAVRRFGGIPPYAETRAYVSRVLALVAR